jgi:hypothetical protein
VSAGEMGTTECGLYERSQTAHLTPRYSDSPTISWSDSVDGPDGELDNGRAADDTSGFALEGWPMMSSHILINPCMSSALSRARSGLDTCDGPLGIEGSGFSTAIDLSEGPDICEIDGGRVADNASGTGEKWASGWPMRLTHILFNSSPTLSGTRSELDTCCGSFEIDGSGFLTATDPSASPGGRELDNGRVADDPPGGCAAGNSSGFETEWLSG